MTAKRLGADADDPVGTVEVRLAYFVVDDSTGRPPTPVSCMLTMPVMLGGLTATSGTTN